MAISVVGTPQEAHANNGADVTMTFDVALAQGDVVVVWGGHFNRGGSSVGPSTAGYISIINDVASNPFFSVAYKVMGASPDSTVTCVGTGNLADAVAYACFALRGISPTVQDATATTAGPTASTNPDPAAIVTQTANAWVLALALNTVVDASPGTISGYSNHVQGSQTDTNPIAVAGATKLIATPTTEDPGAWSAWASGTWKTATLAIRAYVPLVIETWDVETPRPEELAVSVW